jgi:hypothetical protein
MGQGAAASKAISQSYFRLWPGGQLLTSLPSRYSIPSLFLGLRQRRGWQAFIYKAAIQPNIEIKVIKNRNVISRLAYRSVFNLFPSGGRLQLHGLGAFILA